MRDGRAASAMSRARYVAVTVTDLAGEEDVEAFGPFSSLRLAQKFVDEYEEQGCRPAYPLVVIELYPVREGLRQIREEKAANAGDQWS